MLHHQKKDDAILLFRVKREVSIRNDGDDERHLHGKNSSLGLVKCTSQHRYMLLPGSAISSLECI